MSWLRVDAGFWKHPKVQDVELAPIGLHVLALSYCADNLTDGLVPEGWVRRQAFGDLALAQALVDAGLWESDPHGFRVHDYLDYNPSRAAVELDREAAKQRMRKARDSSRSVEVRATSTRSSSNPTPIPTEEASPLQTAVTTSQPPSTTPERSPAVRANTDGVVESGEVIDGDPEAIRLATLMRETMVARWRRHEFRRRAPALTDAWVRDMRLLMRDGAEPKQIEYAIAWMDGASEGGLFWAENVRTPKKLREKWLAIAANIRREGEGSTQGRGASGRRAQRRQEREVER